MGKGRWVFRALMLLLVLTVGGLIQRARSPVGQRSDTAPILFYCAAGMKAPVSKIVTQYEEETGRKVQVNYGGSGSLFTNLSIGLGDLYLAAESDYVDKAEAKGWAAERFDVARLTPGFAVARGNPLGLKACDDLLAKKGLRIALANPEAASVGKTTRKVLTEAGLWEAVEEKVTVFKPTVNELVTDVKLGTIDVAVVWDAVAGLADDVDFISPPEFKAAARTVTLAVLNSSADPSAALHFARYLTASDRGGKQWMAFGYDAILGDPWADLPELVLYSGSMLRPAIDARVSTFSAREGVVIRPVYNGCGILVAQMKAGDTPDAYFACDVSFLDMVQARFEPGVTVSGNRIVMLVRNDKRGQIRTPADLASASLRVGVAHPQKSALGTLTRELLDQLGVGESLRLSGNISVESPTGDFLVNQMRAGALDVALVYRSNAEATPATLEEATVVVIDHPAARATQPWALSKEGAYPQLARRLQSWLTDEDARAAYESKGFIWRP